MSDPVQTMRSIFSALLLIAVPSTMKGFVVPFLKPIHTAVADTDSASMAGQSSPGDGPFQPVNPDGSTIVDPWINVNDALDTEYRKYPLPPDASSSMDFPVCGTPVSVDATPLGAATFSIPIEVPPGVASMTPRLSIAYSSMQGDGPLGLGCFIQGQSGIARSAKDIWHDGKPEGVAYSDADALRLDGRRLMAKSGTGLADGMAYSLEDDPFTTVVQHGTGTGSWFEVKTPDGSILRYGATENSRQTVTMPSGKAVVASWQISSSEDANGNYIEYTYLHDSLSLYPQTIAYGGNRHTSAGAKNAVVFGYGDRPDAHSFIIGGAQGCMSKLLTTIVTKTGETVYRKTRLRYSQDQGSGRSLLNGVRIGITDQKRQKEITVAWNETQTFRPSAKEICGGTSLPLTEKKGQKLLTADMNGDGVTDIIEFAEAEIHTGAGTRQQTNLCIPYLSEVRPDGTAAHNMSQPIDIGKDFSLKKWKQKSGYPLLADMNGDGRSEILLIEPQSLSLGMNPCHFVRYTEDSQEQPVQTFNIVANFTLKQLFTADFDGDGTADFMLVHDDGCYTYLNKNGNFSEGGLARPVADLNVKDADIIDMGDFNGDGIPDFVMFSRGKLAVATGNGDGHFTQHEA